MSAIPCWVPYHNKCHAMPSAIPLWVLYHNKCYTMPSAIPWWVPYHAECYTITSAITYWVSCHNKCLQLSGGPNVSPQCYVTKCSGNITIPLWALVHASHTYAPGGGLLGSHVRLFSPGCLPLIRIPQKEPQANSSGWLALKTTHFLAGLDITATLWVNSLAFLLHFMSLNKMSSLVTKINHMGKASLRGAS